VNASPGRARPDDRRGTHRLPRRRAARSSVIAPTRHPAALRSDRRHLRVLEGKATPSVGVEPPGDKDSRKARRKTFLYPREAATLLACEAIPVSWRETYAIALFTYARPGDLRVLRWSDVDTDANHVRITKAWDYDAEQVEDPKSRNGVREIPIEPAPVPLLARMRQSKPDGALVVPMLDAFGDDHLAEKFREHLLVAKVDPLCAALHATTSTHVQSNFRSCRDSGITWLAMTGIDSAKIVRRAGHDDHNTTMGYVKLAEDLTGNLGPPFGPLPEGLVSPDSAVRPPVRLATIELFPRAGEGIRNLDVHLGKALLTRSSLLRPVTSPQNYSPDRYPRRVHASRIGLARQAQSERQTPSRSWPGVVCHLRTSFP
jgi:integrase